MRFIFVLYFSIFLLSSGIVIHTKRDSQFISKKELSQVDTLYYSSDTIAYLSYINKKAVLLNWGVINSFINTSEDTLYYANKSFLSFNKRKDYFVINDLCGTACNYAYIAPIKKDCSGKLYLYPLKEDESNNLLAYHGNDRNLATIENIITKKKIVIKEKFNNKIRPTNLAIDTCYFKENTFFIRWKLPTGKKKSKETNILKLI